MGGRCCFAREKHERETHCGRLRNERFPFVSSGWYRCRFPARKQQCWRVAPPPGRAGQLPRPPRAYGGATGAVPWPRDRTLAVCAKSGAGVSGDRGPRSAVGRAGGLERPQGAGLLELGYAAVVDVVRSKQSSGVAANLPRREGRSADRYVFSDLGRRVAHPLSRADQHRLAGPHFKGARVGLHVH